MISAEIIADPQRSMNDWNALIESRTPFFLGRIGGSDWDLVAHYLTSCVGRVHPGRILEQPEMLDKVIVAKNYNGYYDREDRPENVIRFIETLIAGALACDSMTVANSQVLSLVGFIQPGHPIYNTRWQQHTKVFNYLVKKAYNYYCIETVTDFLIHCFPKFAGKRILVCSPFCESIQQQFLRKELLFGHLHAKHPDYFPADFRYPEFELVTLPTPVTYPNAASYPHNNWFETTEYLCRKINGFDFDIALLGCGSYAMALGAHIKKIGKGAFYVGGVLQLYFGVYGRRYIEHEWYRRLINEHWIRPTEQSEGSSSLSLEAPPEAYGAYW